MKIPCTVILLIFLVYNCNAVWDTPEPLDIKNFAYAETSSGRIQGLAVEPKPGQLSYVFKNVPYAEPPLGNLRFRNLKERRSWHGVWNSTTYSPACPSNTTKTSSPQAAISEDCIYANIFTDSKCIDGKRKCPVLFYVHGGNFYYDSAVMFNERQIVEKYASDGIVFVIPAFRLGIFGVFDVGDDNIVPKNLGLNDIIFALKWVSKEIANFGGDSKRITVMGNSAGGGIVELLLSHRDIPYDLFKQAIVSSALTSIDKNSARPLSQAILRTFNCTGPVDIREQVDCLRYVDASDLLEAQRHMIEEQGLPFGSVVSSRSLPAKNYPELLRYLKPRTIWFATTSDEMRPELEPSPDGSCQNAMIAFGYKSQAVQNTCVDRYLAPLRNGTKTMTELTAPGTEAIHAQSLLTALVNSHKGGKSYRSLFSLANHSYHADDMLFFFGLHWKNVTYSSEEQLIDAYYPQVVKNFLKRGVLEKEWKPIRKDGRGYYVFDFKLSANATTENSNSSYLQLQKWPQFVNGYDDPDGEQFWLLEMAKLEASAFGYDFKPSNISRNPEKKDDNENSSSERIGEPSDHSGNYPKYDNANIYDSSQTETTDDNDQRKNSAQLVFPRTKEEQAELEKTNGRKSDELVNKGEEWAKKKQDKLLKEAEKEYRFRKEAEEKRNKLRKAAFDARRKDRRSRKELESEELAKKKRDEWKESPIIKPSQKSFEWAKPYNTNSEEDSEDKTNNFKKERSEDKRNSKHRQKYYSPNKQIKNSRNYHSHQFKYGKVSCVYDVGDQRKPRLNCTHYKYPDNDDHSQAQPFQVSPVESNSWNRPLNSTEISEGKKYQQTPDDNSLPSIVSSENNVNDGRKQTMSNSSGVNESKSHSHNKTCHFWCFPNPWWRRNGRRVHYDEKRHSNQQTKTKKFSQKSKYEEKEPPFWLPFFNVNFVLRNESSLSDTFGDFENNKNENELTSAVMDDLNQLDGIQFPNSKKSDPALSYFDKLQRQQLTPNTDVTATEQIQPFNGIEYRLPAFWLSICILLLVISVVLIIVASHMLFRFKNARGYSYISNGEEFLTEKSRFVTRNGYNSPMYTR